MHAFDADRPFVLLESATRGQGAQLFSGLGNVISAVTVDEVRPALDKLRTTAGHRAGFIGFDAGYALEPSLASRAPLAADGLPLLWFGSFDHAVTVKPDQLVASGTGAVGRLDPFVDHAEFESRVARVLAHIAAGDLYQANLTFQASVAVTGQPLALYLQLRAAAAAPFGALVNTGGARLLSFSPELFFRFDRGAVTTRPMKGTAMRAATVAEDDAAALALAADPKNRAENLMIVDLLRNDLSRIADAGSVRVPALFEVERYPTLLQMTSTVVATTPNDAVDVLTALFPCGSVTGAPKIAAMQAIADIEGTGRGVYTGSIGAIDALGDAVFNVAIRTIVIASSGKARIGLGAGIVADSVPADEWRECLAKASFLHRAPGPSIIETMRVDGGSVVEIERHLARARSTAGFLGYGFAEVAIRAAVRAAAEALQSGRLRLLIDRDGSPSIAVGELPASPEGPIAVAAARLPVDPGDWRLRHKTTDRDFYETAREASGCYEVVFVAPDGEVTEGSFTNVFVPSARGLLATPPLTSGLLPGVLRARLLEAGQAIEQRLTVADLAHGFLVGNAVRGLVPAVLVESDERPFTPSS